MFGRKKIEKLENRIKDLETALSDVKGMASQRDESLCHALSNIKRLTSANTVGIADIKEVVHFQQFVNFGEPPPPGLIVAQTEDIYTIHEVIKFIVDWAGFKSLRRVKTSIEGEDK